MDVTITATAMSVAHAGNACRVADFVRWFEVVLAKVFTLKIVAIVTTALSVVTRAGRACWGAGVVIVRRSEVGSEDLFTIGDCLECTEN